MNGMSSVILCLVQSFSIRKGKYVDAVLLAQMMSLTQIQYMALGWAQGCKQMRGDHMTS